MNYKVEILTGVRPTGSLTVANYLGAIFPIIQLQNQGFSPIVFVADLHAMTDTEPSLVKQYIPELIADYLALGIDPQKTKIYLQSAIGKEVAFLTLILARLVSVAELLRVPTLKDKLKNKDKPETANALLLLYPTMMAADILLNRAKKIPVGEDQLAHLEMVSFLAEKFNKKYGKVFPIPKPLQVKSLRILSLQGEGKMSKTNPKGAIFLTDDKETVAKKIKRAETALEGIITPKLESHITLSKGLAKTKEEIEEIERIIKEHKKGKKVMKAFKELMTKIVQDFLKEFQEKREKVLKDKEYIFSILNEGNQIAKQNALETLEEVKKAINL